MRVVLEVVSGPFKGRKTVLGTNDSLSIGRSDWAQLVCTYDDRMSRVHFKLRSDEMGCYLIDPSSRNGTFVNGMRVTDCMLRDGDRINAGMTDFVVEIEGDSPEQARTMTGTSWVPKDVDSVLQKSTQQRLNVHYTIEPCDSHLTLYRGEIAALSPAKLALVMRLMHPLHIIVDLKRLGMPLPEGLGEPQYLFDWLDPLAAKAASPILISPAADNDAWKPLVDEGWGQDAVVCLFSKLPTADLVAHWRTICRGKSGGHPAVYGYCWPSVLAPVLTHSPASQVSKLMTGIECVLVEFPDLPETWQLFGDAMLAQALNKFGFTPPLPPGTPGTEPVNLPGTAAPGTPASGSSSSKK
ncbi:MAG: FHA domain-containing protein [Planctomycetia bacterium]|nr:FHA domain-containing protein [Planctomycetia bacterium]